MSLVLTVLSLDCSLKNCPVNPPNPTFTPTISATTTNSPTATTTSSPSNTPSPSPTNTPTVTPTCYTYTDSYASNTIANHDIYDGAWNPSTAAAQSITITSGELDRKSTRLNS